MIEISLTILLLLFVVAIVASYIDTLAGGGGLITIPALLLAGVPPLMALGTNKLQSSFGVATASVILYNKGLFEFKQVKPLILTALLGAVAGTIFVQFIDTDTLNVIIPLVITFIMIYFILPTRFTQDNKSMPNVSSKAYKNIIIPIIGFYDGALGPATGSFFSLAGVACKKQDLVTATIHAKTFNLATNLASLIVFIYAGQIIWLIGAVMIAGQLIGAKFASNTLTTINPIWLKRLIIIVCALMLIKYVINL